MSKRFLTQINGTTASLTGLVTASAFSGDGSLLTNLPSSGISGSAFNNLSASGTASINNLIVSGSADVVYQTDGRAGGYIYTGSVAPGNPQNGDIWIDNSLSTDPTGNTSIQGTLTVSGNTLINSNVIITGTASVVRGITTSSLVNAASFTGTNAYLSGSLAVSGGMITLPLATGVSANTPTTNSLVLNNRSYIFDDGNLHINTNDGTIWINSNNATPVQINTQGTASTGGLIVGGSISSANLSDSGWIAPSSFSNSFASVTNPVNYRKLNGVVYLRGSIQSGTAGTTAFTLPVGYRPAAAGTYTTQQYGTANDTYITVNPDGTVVPNTSSTWLSGVAIPIG